MILIDVCRELEGSKNCFLPYFGKFSLRLFGTHRENWVIGSITRGREGKVRLY